MESLGILESNSIAKGIEAADAALKAAEVSLLYARPVCPGKYSILFYGDVAAVDASLVAGSAVLDDHLVDSVSIPRIHPQVIHAIGLSVEPPPLGAVGVMEFFSVTAAVYAADAAVKAADVMPVSYTHLDVYKRQVLSHRDIAKALGQLMRQKAGGRPVVAIDGIEIGSGQFIDLGMPVLNGMAVPAIVKTLIFES